MAGYTAKKMESENAKKIDKAFGRDNSFLEFNPGKCLLPPSHTLFAERILSFDVREDDIWLISFPRTGSTWCQEMIWLLGNDLDFKSAQTLPQQIRAPLLELSSLMFQHKDVLQKLFPFNDTVEFVDKMKSPRFIKSHLPLDLLPTQLDKVKPKIICTMRNPKDMIISFYHYCRIFHDLSIPLEDFCDLFLDDSTPMGSVWSHYLGFWNKRHDENILVLKYEDMKKDSAGTIRQIAEHLGKNVTEKEIGDIKEFLSFSNMRENKACNLEVFIDTWKGKNYYKRSGDHFIRKGIVGDWKNVMSEEMAEKFDKWIEENTRGTGLNFEEV
ncbi:unnamed protein product [Brassicogethes aeneus]|uniref:Sulfotransferase domain-containing protein n=1 Tax=Brassicogethes aeneus TaxID=1431903 RepID=A0A9P0FHG0_BRAAE|nr:unnamed protein product [Brassicogethes aeneus]